MRDETEPQFDRRDAAAVAVLVIVLVAMFWKVLFTSQMFFYRDVFNYTYPHAKFIHDAVRHGRLPYWNPLLNYGEPVLADPNFLFFYPFTLAIVLLPVAYAYCLHYVLHFAIAAAGTYCLARQWRQSRWAALFAAAAFGLSGPLLSLGNFYNHAACAAWIPWALFLTDRAIAKRGLRSWILLAGCFSLQFLAGEMFTLLATFVLCFAYALWRISGLQRRRPAALRVVAVFGCVGAAMVALCAVQLIPASHLLAHSRRGLQGLPYHETTYWSFNPLRLIELAVPGFYGSPLNSPSIWDFALNGRNNPYLVSVFLGFATLFLALLGGVFGSGRRRRFAAIAAGALLLLSFGRFTPVFALLYLLFPPLELVRFPAKLLVPFTLMIALLAGWGIDAVRDGETRWLAQRRVVLLPLGVLLAAAVAAWVASFALPGAIGEAGARIVALFGNLDLRPTARPLTATEISGGGALLVTLMKVYLPGLAGFLLGELIWFQALEQKRPWARRILPIVAVLVLCRLAFVNSSVNPTVPKRFYSYLPPVLSKVNAPASEWRLASVYRKRVLQTGKLNPASFLNFDSIPWVSRLSMLAQGDFRARLVLSRAAMLTGKEVILNNDVDLSFPAELFHFWVFFGAQMPDATRADCLLGRTNVRYEIFGHPQHSATLRELAPVFNGSPEPSYLYENLCAVPRAYAAAGAIHSGSPLETLTLLSRPGFDVHQSVILPAGDDAGPRDLQSRGLLSAYEKTADLKSGEPDQANGAGPVRIVRYLPNNVVLQAQMKRPGYVVLLDRYSPDWQVWVDGRPARLLRANLLFRAVRVPAGEHLIRFEYRQAGLMAGALISLLALTLLIAVFVRDPLREVFLVDAKGFEPLTSALRTPRSPS